MPTAASGTWTDPTSELGSTIGSKRALPTTVRSYYDIANGYYKIGRYEGLIKNYDKPFTPENHDALTENDYVWAQFIDNQILPVGMHK